MKYLLVIFSFFLLTSCIVNLSPRPVENYKGGIIYEKKSYEDKYQFIIKMKGKKQDIQTDSFYYEYVYVLKADFERYNISDTMR